MEMNDILGALFALRKHVGEVLDIEYIDSYAIYDRREHTFSVHGDILSFQGGSIDTPNNIIIDNLLFVVSGFCVWVFNVNNKEQA